MKTILVPTDFSTAAKNAAEYAANLALKIDAKLLLFHAYHVPIYTSDYPNNIISPLDLQQINEEQLKNDALNLEKKTGVKVNYLAKIGFAVEEILDEEVNATMIVMGMRDASKLSEILIGSITTSVIKKSKKPIFVIPEEARFKKIEKIVFATDYDISTDLSTIETLKNITKTFNSKIYVVNVIANEEAEVTADEFIVGRNLETKLKDVEHVYYFPENEDLIEGINEFANEHQADLISMIPHRHNFIDLLFQRSISKKMAFHTHIPLLTLPDNHKTTAIYL